MKRFYIALIGLMGIVGLASCSRDVVEVKAEGGALYRQYAARTDLTVAQVTGFELGNSVKTDVVILVADDSTAWQGLKQEFDIRTSEGVTSWMGDIDHPAQHVKGGKLPAWRAMAVHSDRTIAFYRIDDSLQYQALLDYQMDKLVNR